MKQAKTNSENYVMGFVPPQIMNWDKANLEGKVKAKDIVATAKIMVKKCKMRVRILSLHWLIQASIRANIKKRIKWKMHHII